MRNNSVENCQEIDKRKEYLSQIEARKTIRINHQFYQNSPVISSLKIENAMQQDGNLK
jgi:hypothetical protein